MIGGHDRPLRHLEGGKRKTGRIRFVNVQHIKMPGDDEFPNLRKGSGAKRKAGDGAIIGDGNTGAAADHKVGNLSIVAAGTNDAHKIALANEVGG